MRVISGPTEDSSSQLAAPDSTDEESLRFSSQDTEAEIQKLIAFFSNWTAGPGQSPQKEILPSEKRSDRSSASTSGLYLPPPIRFDRRMRTTSFAPNGPTHSSEFTLFGDGCMPSARHQLIIRFGESEAN